MQANHDCIFTQNYTAHAYEFSLFKSTKPVLVELMFSHHYLYVTVIMVTTLVSSPERDGQRLGLRFLWKVKYESLSTAGVGLCAVGIFLSWDFRCSHM